MDYLDKLPNFDLSLFTSVLNTHVIHQRLKLYNLFSLLTTIDHERCMARIHDKTQCTRKCKTPHTKLCGSHSNSIPYGRIDDQELITDSYRKSKGKMSSSKSDKGTDMVDLDQYIKTESIIIDDKEFLIDDNNLIFDTNIDHTIIGLKINENQYQWF